MCINAYGKVCKIFYVLLFRVTEPPLRLIIRDLIFKCNTLCKHTHTHKSLPYKAR